MSSTEDYLDRLLRSVTEGVPMEALEPKNEEESLVENANFDDDKIVFSDDIGANPEVNPELNPELNFEVNPEVNIETNPEAEKLGLEDINFPEFKLDSDSLMGLDNSENNTENTEALDINEGLQGGDAADNFDGIEGLEELGGFENNEGLQGIDDADNFDGIEGLEELGGLENNEGLQGGDAADNFDGIEGLEELGGLENNEGPQGIEDADNFDGIEGLEGLEGLENIEGLQNSEEEIDLNEIENSENMDSSENMDTSDNLDISMNLDDIDNNGEPLVFENLEALDIPNELETIEDASVEIENEIENEIDNSMDSDTSIQDDIDLMSDSMLDDMLAEITNGAEDNSDSKKDSLEDEDIANLLKSIEEMENNSFSDLENKSDDLSSQTNNPDEFEGFNDTISAFGEDDDLGDMLASMQDGAELSEIGDLLSKNDNNELVEDDSQASEENDNIDFSSISSEKMYDIEEAIDEDDDPFDEDEGKKKKKKKEKKKKEKGEKKPGLIARIISALFEEVQDEEQARQVFEESAIDIASEGDVDNQKILKEMSADGKKPKKKEKKKKEKPKKEAKPKKEKVKKPKKEKPPKEKEEDPQQYVKLPKKKVIPICIFCFTIGVALVLLSYAYPYYLDVKSAESSFDHENYQDAFWALEGHKLNEEEEELYKKTVVILRVERKYDSYNNYMNMNKPLEALNALVQGVKLSDELYDEAYGYGVIAQFEKYKNLIIEALNNSFGVSEGQAREWADIEDTEKYTRTLKEHLEAPVSESGNIETIYSNENDIILSEEAEFIEQQPEEVIVVNDIDDLDALEELFGAEIQEEQ